MSWIREPLLQFFLVGVVIFMVVEFQQPASRDESLIKVDKESLLRFYQFRTQSFTANAADAMDQLSEGAMRDLIARFVREEALYRTALSYGMDKDDYVIRRRLVQKVEFLAEDEPDENQDLAETDIQAYYAAHAESFRQPGVVTFTHVFLGVDRHGPELAETASALLKKLNDQQVSFSQAGRYGDRFAYLRNYVERNADELASHFGTGMVAELVKLSPDPVQWQGPIFSAYGAHLVLLTSIVPDYLPEVNDVRGKIANQIIAQREKTQKQRFIDDVVSQYRVEVAEDYRAFAAQPR